MDKNELIKKITEKKEFSDLPEKDVELAFLKFDKERNAEYQKLKLTRDLLRKVYSSFSSRKLLNPKEQEPEWVLMKHKSTKERFFFYPDIYSRVLRGHEKNESLSIIDLGCGVNGFSFDFLKEINSRVKYIGVEAIGQLCKLTNLYFEGKGFNAKAHHFSLFEPEKVTDLIKKSGAPRIVFLFKIIDSLEVMQRDYSKELLRGIVPLCDRVVVSFATRSLGSRKKFFAQRGWLVKFINEEFNLEEDFECGGERYIAFSKKSL